MPSFRQIRQRIRELREEDEDRIGGLRNVSQSLLQADDNLSRILGYPLPQEGPLGKGVEDIRRVQRTIRRGRRAIEFIRRAKTIGDLIRFGRGR